VIRRAEALDRAGPRHRRCAAARDMARPRARGAGQGTRRVRGRERTGSSVPGQATGGVVEVVVLAAARAATAAGPGRTGRSRPCARGARVPAPDLVRPHDVPLPRRVFCRGCRTSPKRRCETSTSHIAPLLSPLVVRSSEQFLDRGGGVSGHLDHSSQGTPSGRGDGRSAPRHPAVTPGAPASPAARPPWRARTAAGPAVAVLHQAGMHRPGQGRTGGRHHRPAGSERPASPGRDGPRAVVTRQRSTHMAVTWSG